MQEVVNLLKIGLMPKIFEYLGILIFFYSNDHEPIHVHGKYENFESKAEFFIENGRIVKIVIKSVKGVSPLKGSKLKDFEDLIKEYGDRIIDKWINYFVLHKEVDFERIERRLK